MASVLAVSKQKSAIRAKSFRARLSLEEEILSLNSLAPRCLSQLPELFSESVVDAASRILGEATGEALVRCVGDSKLRDPDAVYDSLDSFLGGGAGDVKKVIQRVFAGKVHNLYRITLEVVSRPRII